MPSRAPLHVVEVDAGDHDGDTFLFLHGYGASSYMWRHWLHAFASRGRVLLVDLKGFGDAPKPDDDRYSPYDLAEAVVDFIHEHDVRRLTLVGQSLGGGIALLVAVALRTGGPEPVSAVPRVQRMVLLAPAAYRQRLPPFVWLSRRPRLATAIIRLFGAHRVLEWTMRSVVHDPSCITEEQIAEYARPWSTPDGVRAALAVGRQIVPPDLDERTRHYRDLDVPAFLLWGEHDPVVPLESGRRLELDLPRARLAILEGCGHMVTDENPLAALALVEGFLEEHPVSS